MFPSIVLPFEWHSAGSSTVPLTRLLFGGLGFSHAQLSSPYICRMMSYIFWFEPYTLRHSPYISTCSSNRRKNAESKIWLKKFTVLRAKYTSFPTKTVGQLLSWMYMISMRKVRTRWPLAQQSIILPRSIDLSLHALRSLTHRVRQRACWV